MRVLVIGATGAVGRPLVRLLAERRHDVIPVSRSRGVGAATRNRERGGNGRSRRRAERRVACTPGPGAASEDTRLWLDGPPSVEAVAATEAAAGTSLRCGLFYGPRFPSWRQGFESL